MGKSDEQAVRGGRLLLLAAIKHIMFVGNSLKRGVEGVLTTYDNALSNICIQQQLGNAQPGV